MWKMHESQINVQWDFFSHSAAGGGSKGSQGFILIDCDRVCNTDRAEINAMKRSCVGFLCVTHLEVEAETSCLASCLEETGAWHPDWVTGTAVYYFLGSWVVWGYQEPASVGSSPPAEEALAEETHNYWMQSLNIQQTNLYTWVQMEDYT